MGASSVDKQPVVIYNAQGQPISLSASAPADASALGTPLAVAALMKAYNGASVDLIRNNTEIVWLTPAPRTSLQTSSDYVNYNHQGATFFFNISNAPGVDTVQLIVDAKDPATGAYRALLSNAATATTGLAVYQIGPGRTASGGLSTATAVALPRTFRLRVVHSAASSFTYAVGFCLH